LALSTALKARRAARYFSKRPIEDELLFRRAGFTKDDFLASAKKKIDANKHLVIESEEKFTEFLDDLPESSRRS